MFNNADLPKSSEDSPDTEFDADAEPSAAAPPVRFGRLVLCVATASALAFGVVGTVVYGIWFNHDQQAYAEAMAGARQALGTAASAAVGEALANPIAPPRPATLVAAPRSETAAAAAATAAAPRSATTATAAERTAGGVQVAAVTPAVTGTQATAGTPATAQTQAAAAASGEEEKGGKLTSWAGPVTRLPASAASQNTVADASPGVAASSDPPAHRAAPPSNPAAQQRASGRSGRDARLAQQDRRSSSAANAGHKGSLFARMSSFFRRVSYRQHGTGSQQDIYSHS
ncbi:hypothetical protein AYM40_27095 [Paraburkholderia phytofirmans OLGA172]|uniref:Uncharacterized protein n=1 Tax=Paraburkholderia phytofirmans OLGA172 TaxID=1417228 RepID=A0A167WDI8_9BURK|nr:hypothetical protein [Paraburkholderia phytofirmans]ANB75957.1 hypothetical protein AYM40_27095 [Paraburkholderia phytofirmans OLGA172]